MVVGKPLFRIRHVVAIASGLLMGGCASDSKVIGGAKDLTVVSSEALPAPSLQDLAASDRPYRVGPFDKLMIDVFNSKELSGKEIQVDASGRISFPLVGTVEVAGKTPGEIEGILEGLFRGRFIKNPQVTVNLKEIVSQTVTIGGEVKEPGVYPVVGRMTLMRAVATAKGTTEFSKKNEVLVFRRVNGSEYAALYDMRAIQRGNYPDPDIYANDVVMVGDSNARRMFKDFLTASPLIAPVFYLLSNSN